MQAVGAIPKKKEVAIVEHPQPSLGRDDEALVKSLEVGICGTDREICTLSTAIRLLTQIISFLAMNRLE